MRFGPVLFASLFLCACQSAPGEEVGSVSSPITSGTPANGDDAVVALRYPLGEKHVINCTGTLVGTREVLTAAHCVAPFPPDSVVFGSNADGSHIEIRSTDVHPGFDPKTLAFDLARVVLATDASVEPIDIRRAREVSAPEVGERVRLVGFGRAETAQPPQKRTGEARIVSVTDDRFTVGPDPSLSCSGDSGGPAFVVREGEEVFAGVVSSGDWDCLERATYTRTTLGADFLDAARGDDEDEAGACDLASKNRPSGVPLLAVVLAVFGVGRRRWRSHVRSGMLAANGPGPHQEAEVENRAG
jgi:secreted trypsin-like serine protease